MTLQHVFGNILQCGSDSLLEFFNVNRKRGDIDKSFHISPEEKSHSVRSGDRGGHFSRIQAENHCRIGECYQRHAAACFCTSLITDLTCAESQAVLILNICGKL